MFWRGIIAELLWMLSGDINVRVLQEQGVHIWDAWADEQGELGPVYGQRWRAWPYHVDGDESLFRDSMDQIADVIDSLTHNPYSRRHVVTAWNPAEVEDMALPPCHTMFQFYSRPLSSQERLQLARANTQWLKLDFPAFDAAGVPARALSCQLYQRSGDLFLGVPFNIASYALLTTLIARMTGHLAERFVHTLRDAHIYNNHIDQVREQLNRTPRRAPTLTINRTPAAIEDYRLEDFELAGYEPHPLIRAPVAV